MHFSTNCRNDREDVIEPMVFEALLTPKAERHSGFIGKHHPAKVSVLRFHDHRKPYETNSKSTFLRARQSYGMSYKTNRIQPLFEPKRESAPKKYAEALSTKACCMVSPPNRQAL